MRYLAEGRLTIARVEPLSGLIVAHCKGQGAGYALGWDPKAKEWRCTCEASAKFRLVCSHLIALKLVTERST